MNTLLVSHPDCLKHDPGPGHPERIARLEYVLEAVRALSGLIEFPAPLVTERQVLRVHTKEYWATLLGNEPKDGVVQLDPDTYMSAGSLNATMRSAGAVCLAVDQVVSGKFANAFCAVRPPGHHAEPDKAMGFCLLNGVAIGAAHALSLPEINRVAIIDFDVHHGNGTQAIFATKSEAAYLSTHQRSLYPGTGLASDRGCGNIFNYPLPPNADGESIKAVYRESLLPQLRLLRPEVIFISAGFDAHKDDPLAQLNLETDDYYWLTESICQVAREMSQGRVISILEGGYDLEALAASAAQHVKALVCEARLAKIQI